MNILAGLIDPPGNANQSDSFFGISTSLGEL